MRFQIVRTMKQFSALLLVGSIVVVLKKIFSNVCKSVNSKLIFLFTQLKPTFVDNSISGFTCPQNSCKKCHPKIYNFTTLHRLCKNVKCSLSSSNIVHTNCCVGRKSLNLSFYFCSDRFLSDEESHVWLCHQLYKPPGTVGVPGQLYSEKR